MDLHHWINILMISAVILLIALMMPLTRSMIAYTIGRILHPMMEAILKHISLRIWSAILAVWRAHWTLLRNLSKPKDRIYPDLQKRLDRERREKVKASL